MLSPLSRKASMGMLFHQGHPLREVARVRQAPRMTTLFAPALCTPCRSGAMSATLLALPAAALPVRRDLT